MSKDTGHKRTAKLKSSKIKNLMFTVKTGEAFRPRMKAERTRWNKLSAGVCYWIAEFISH